ncbi:MAG: hypothetical protein NZL95_04945 [Chitinophagales bacterium]|nr:hypothetical protein [Chitinophagales bacterium]MDW8427881.1 hypothetical protein [Chitinophagales bacterium]
MRLINPYAGEIIDDNGENENQNIDGYKKHIKDAAGNEQVKPPPSVGQKEVDGGDHRKEYQKGK